MWKPAAVLLLLLAHSLPALCQWSDDAQRCADATDPDQGLPFCNAAIQAGQLSPANLSITFNNRGGMYSKKGEFDQAIQDFHQAIRFNPGNSVAFRNEGDAFSVKGEYQGLRSSQPNRPNKWVGH
jgi:tetratricopeptide (TPR) repeat protein